MKTIFRLIHCITRAALTAFAIPVTAAPGELDTTFNPTISSVESVATAGGGKILICGNFTTVNGIPRKNIARLHPDGTLDTSFGANVNFGVSSTAIQPDGKIVIGGSFTSIGGVARNYLARLHADGTLDTSFNPDAGGAVSCLVVQSDGKIIVGGYFPSMSGVVRNSVARLNSDGTLDGAFNPNPNVNSGVLGAAVQADGKILIAGNFATVGGTARNCVAKINADGTLDGGFNPNPDSTVFCVTIQADGKIIIGGGFTTLQPNGALNPTSKSRLARLNADGTLDSGFSSTADTVVYGSALQTDGKIILWGAFTNVGGVTRNRFCRLLPDGSVEPAFNPNLSSNVQCAAIQADGKIILGGQFGTVGAISRSNLARLENDTAPQSLTIPSSSRVQWLRGGSSAETLQVTFDLSTDGGGIWTGLGAGTRIAGGWERTGLTLPTGGQVRGRARTFGGQNNGSTGLVEALTAFGVQPEIAVELSAGTNFADGGTTSFGDRVVGSSASLTFTIRNTGTAALTGFGITKDGTNASEFTVTASPTAPVAGPNGSTTFTVQFTPTALAACRT